MQVVGDDDGGEVFPGQGPGRVALEVGLDDLGSGVVLQVGNAAGVAVDGGNVESEVQEQSRVAAAAAGHVHHGAPYWCEGREAAHPG